MNIISIISDALESYVFPNSCSYPNVCYTASDKEELPQRILEGLKDAFWPLQITIREAINLNLVPIIQNSIAYYQNYPNCLPHGVVYVIELNHFEIFCKEIEEVIKNCFHLLDENTLLSQLEKELINLKN